MIFYYLLLFILGFALIFLAGHCIISLSAVKIEKTYNRSFFKLFLGLTFIITCYSLLKTSGGTINAGLILIGILYYTVTKQKFDLKGYKERLKIYKTDFLPLLTILVFSSLFFFWKYYCLFNNGQAFPIVINSDSIYHSNLAIFLNSTGIESSNTNYFYLPDGTHPYHYFEGWTIAFFSFIFNSNYWITEECLVYPLFASIVVAGTWALFEKFIALTTFNKCLGLLTVFFSGFYFSELSELSELFNYQETYSYGYNAIDEFWGLKLVVAYIFAIAALLLFIDQKIKHGILILLALPVISISVAAGVLSATFMFILFLLFFKKKINSIISPYTLLLPVIVCLFIALFYKLSSATTEYISIPSSSNIITEFNSITVLKSKIVLFFLRIIQLIILYAPVWILLLLSFLTSQKGTWSKHFSKLKFCLFYLPFIIFCSLIIWLILSFSFGSKAFYFYAALPFINVLSLLIIAISYNFMQKTYFKWGTGIVILSMMVFFLYRTNSIYSYDKNKLWSIYSKEYLEEVYAHSKNIQGKFGGKIEGVSFFNSGIYNDNIDKLGYFLSGFNRTADKSSILTSLSSIDVTQEQLDQTINKGYVLTTPLYLFTNELKKNKHFTSNENARLQFIKKHKIEYLFINKGIQMDSCLLPFISKYLKDPKSGISFILLDQEKLLKTNSR